SRVAGGVHRVARQRVDADGFRDRQPAAGEDLQHLQVHLIRLARAADLLRVRQAEQPGAAQGPQHGAGKLAALLVAGGPRGELPVGQFGGEVEQVVRLAGGEDALDGHGEDTSSKGCAGGFPQAYGDEWDVSALVDEVSRDTSSLYV